MPRDRGDFIGVVGLGAGFRLAGDVLRTARNTLGVPPVVTLQAPRALLGWQTDTPDTLAYEFMADVQALLQATLA